MLVNKAYNQNKGKERKAPRRASAAAARNNM